MLLYNQYEVRRQAIWEINEAYPVLQTQWNCHSWGHSHKGDDIVVFFIARNKSSSLSLSLSPNWGEILTNMLLDGSSLVFQLVKTLPAMCEMQVRSRGQEDPLEKEWLGRSPGEGKGYPLQYSGLENPMDCIVHEFTKSWTWLSDFHFTTLHPLQYSWLGNSMDRGASCALVHGSHTIGHDWATNTLTFMILDKANLDFFLDLCQWIC